MNISDAAREAECTIPPEGWRCTRQKGHDGPCAAVPSEIRVNLGDGASASVTPEGAKNPEFMEAMMKMTNAVKEQFSKPTVRRFANSSDDWPSANGRWVPYEDHTTATAALTLERDQLRQQLAEARGAIEAAAHWFNREPSSPRDAIDNLRKAEAVLLQALNPPTDEK